MSIHGYLIDTNIAIAYQLALVSSDMKRGRCVYGNTDVKSEGVSFAEGNYLESGQEEHT